MTAPAAKRERDVGSTLPETLMSVLVLGIIMTTIAMAISTTFRVNPDTETRLDDARATRGLATWLAGDTISAPPFLPETAQGGIVLDQDPSATNNNDCAAPGTNLVHLQWTEVTDQARTYVANYRWVIDPDGTASIVRHVCWRAGTDPFTQTTQRTLTSALTASSPPTITALFNASGDVDSIQFELVGDTGETVLVETGSRNPADFFP